MNFDLISNYLNTGLLNSTGLTANQNPVALTANQNSTKSLQDFQIFLRGLNSSQLNAMGASYGYGYSQLSDSNKKKFLLKLFAKEHGYSLSGIDIQDNTFLIISGLCILGIGGYLLLRKKKRGRK